ncbi:VOC family protein [Parabacteroides sp. ZJ-118]|uniref:VOC family protein n=1 Tax=Parabacteroides sp. ZJ-118 TaxID=2709398 RepID=UPI0013EBD013|nr:VOC family protein [Parabacteroides sp. ZJ-118]
MKNLIAFFEIPATDFDRAVDFYQSIFGMELAQSACGNEKMACFVQDGQAVGALSHAPGFRPSADGVLIYFHCDDMDPTLGRVKECGGKVMIPRTRIQVEGRGSFAVFADPEGNRIGLYAD